MGYKQICTSPRQTKMPASHHINAILKQADLEKMPLRVNTQAVEKSKDYNKSSAFAFRALTLLVGWQQGHPACKKLSGGMLAWLSFWGEVQICIWSS